MVVSVIVVMLNGTARTSLCLTGADGVAEYTQRDRGVKEDQILACFISSVFVINHYIDELTIRIPQSLMPSREQPKQIPILNEL